MAKNNVKISIAADTAQAKQQLNNFSKELNQSKRSVRDLTAAYEQLDNATKSSSVGKNMKKDLDSAINKYKELENIQKKVKENLSIGIDEKDIKMPDIGSLLTKSLNSAGFSGASSAIETLGGLMGGSLTAGAVAATAGVAAAGVAIKEFAEVAQEAIQKSAAFGQALSELSAITGVHGNELNTLRGQIQDLAKETNSSVVDVTNGMAKIGGAMPQLLDDTAGLGEMFKQSSILAKAGLMSQDEATKSLTTIMAQFNHTVNESAKDVDILANASQAGSAEISDLAGTMKVAGVAANSAGLSLQEAAAMAEVLGDNALKGSEAGTQLRNIYSKFSAAGIKDADEMMQTLAAHTGDTGWMVKQFGLDSANAAQMLSAGGERYKELLSALNETGTATQMAQTNFDNLNGDISKIQTTWDNFLSSFNVDAADGPVRELVQSFDGLVNAVIELAQQFQNSSVIQDAVSNWSEALSDVIDMISSLLGIVGELIGLFFDLLGATDSTTSMTEKFLLILRGLKEQMEMVRNVVGLLRAAIQWLLKQFADFKNYVLAGISKIPLFEKIGEYVDWAKKKVQQLIDWWNNLKKAVIGASTEINKATNNKGNNSNKPKDNKQDKKPNTNPQNLPKANMSFGGGSTSNSGKSKSNTRKTNTKSSNSNSNTSNTKQDPIKQANEAYVKTMTKLNGQLKDSIITQADYDKKKESALKTLIESYYAAGKTKENSPELNKKIEELGTIKDSIHTNEVNTAIAEYQKTINKLSDEYGRNLSTQEEYDKSLLSAEDKLIDKLLEIGNLTTEEENQLQSYINEVKEAQKQSIITELNKSIKDITKNDSSIRDNYTINVHQNKESNKAILDELIKQYDEIQKEKSKQLNAAIEIGVTINTDGIDAQLDDLKSKIEDTSKEVLKDAQFDNIFNGLNDVNDIASGIENIASSFDNVKNPLDAFTAGISTLTNAMQMYKTITELVTIVQDLFGASTEGMMAKSSAAADKEQTDAMNTISAKEGESIANATAEGSKMPWPENLIAIAVGVAAVLAAFASISGAFATGGIVNGSTTTGDNTLIRVNSGEMVLNDRQQTHLFKMLDGGLALNTSNTSSGEVNFRISGSNLYGTLKNYSNMQNKVGRNIKL